MQLKNNWRYIVKMRCQKIYYYYYLQQKSLFVLTNFTVLVNVLQFDEFIQLMLNLLLHHVC